MKTTLVPITLALPPPLHPRSPGIHLSGIIRAIAIEVGALKAEWVEAPEEATSLMDRVVITDPVVILRISIGLAWEEWYIRTQLPHVVDHPGEMELDGIYMTPDGESLDTILTELQMPRTVTAIHEIKATYKSLKTIAPRQVSQRDSDPEDLSSQLLWLMQMKGYCKAAGTRLAYLHALLLCGDYSFPITPQLWCWRIEFTEQELDDNWDLVRDYRDHRLRLDIEGASH